mmetsp:Transcript_2021/g.5666  ORF Transcript_2021/g.5666 Transcript_2021/m.5666 type:complete len:424 (-) Transcript_2021:61-1332(-)
MFQQLLLPQPHARRRRQSRKDTCSTLTVLHGHARGWWLVDVLEVFLERWHVHPRCSASVEDAVRAHNVILQCLVRLAKSTNVLLRVWQLRCLRPEDGNEQLIHLGPLELVLVEEVKGLEMYAPLAEAVDLCGVGEPRVEAFHFEGFRMQVIQHIQVDVVLAVQLIPELDHPRFLTAEAHDDLDGHLGEGLHRLPQVPIRRHAVSGDHDNDLLARVAQSLLVLGDHGRDLTHTCADGVALLGVRGSRGEERLERGWRVHCEGVRPRVGGVGMIEKRERGRRVEERRELGVKEEEILSLLVARTGHHALLALMRLEALPVEEAHGPTIVHDPIAVCKGALGLEHGLGEAGRELVAREELPHGTFIGGGSCLARAEHVCGEDLSRPGDCGRMRGGRRCTKEVPQGLPACTVLVISSGFVKFKVESS